MVHRIAALALPLLAGACFNVSAEGVACGENDLCPSGLECISGLCLQPGSTVDVDDGGAPPDQAPIPPDAMVPLGDFGTATVVGGLNTDGLEDDPSLTADQLEIYFNRGANDELWVATRATTADPWGTPVELTALGTVNEAQVLPDGLTMYFTSDRNGAQFDIFRTTRADRESAWGAPIALGTPVNLAGSDQRGPCVNSADTIMIIPSDPVTNNEFHLYRTTRANPGAAWEIPQPLTSLNGAAGIELDCWFADDESEIYLGSNRDGDPNLYRAVGDGAGNYSMVEPAPGINVATESRVDPWLSPDRRTIYFTRAEQGGDGDIYTATR